jgi:hypothetical protein
MRQKTGRRGTRDENRYIKEKGNQAGSEADLCEWQRLIQHPQCVVGLLAVIIYARERQEKLAFPLGVSLGKAPHGVCDGGHRGEEVLVGALALEGSRGAPVRDARVVD